VRQDVAKSITGHRTDSVYSRYNITSAEDLADALGRARAYAAEQGVKV
jgi:hypothetical protein